MATATLIITVLGVLVSMVGVGDQIWDKIFPKTPWYETTWGMCIIIGGILAIAFGVCYGAIKSQKR